jgi:acetolactate decarboxylase
MRRILLLLNGIVLAGILQGQDPVMWVLDTDFSKGRLTHVQTITPDDLARFHGHRCDGLVAGYLGLREALWLLYPDYLVDRTNTRVVSRSAPCLVDAAMYLTGGRYPFNTFYVSDSMEFMFVLQRMDNLRTLGVRLKPGIKPAGIEFLGELANAGLLNACELDSLRRMEDDFIRILESTGPGDLFDIVALDGFGWDPPFVAPFVKTDVLNKHVPACKPNQD